MATIDREIKTKLENTTELLLKGAAADYTAYASLVARYRVLKELADFLAEQAETEGDDVTHGKE